MMPQLNNVVGMNGQKSIQLSAALWRQLLHDKPIKFRFSDSNEFENGHTDVVCFADGQVRFSIFYPSPSGPQMRKLELDQAMFDCIGWSEDNKAFMATFHHPKDAC